ncbi:hypothetical protein [Labrenzia sp. PHM005]|uniref:hypothetical protein n=1 Tax=Labrenzia sp. PHM005 TaxID=2590016 RepID=UPI0011403EF3|nr:hypothetical protein [Labrenzia sp. PHM005]QDG76715.1 hypothetical protein FJ695_13000 [Labrenzia sp. PHM005]
MIIENSSVVGHFEGLRDGCLCGWAVDSNDYGLSVPFLLKIDDLEPIFVIADLFRSDLENEGYGDGCHAFRVPAPSVFRDGMIHTVTFLDQDTGQSILNSPYKLQVSELTPLSTQKGALDAIEGPNLRGWACDMDQPNEAATLVLLLNNEVALEFKADRYRPDLEDLGMGSGNHGFEIAVPNAKQLTIPSRLEIRFKDGNVPLEGCPVGYFNPGDILSLVSQMEKRLDDQEDRLMFLDYLVREHLGKA